MSNSKASARLSEAWHSLSVQQPIHARLSYLIDPSSAKKVPSKPWMRLQVFYYVASFSLWTCRMTWHGAGREVEEGQGHLKSLFGHWCGLSSCLEVSMGMGLQSCTAHQHPEIQRSCSTSQTCTYKAVLLFFFFFLNLLLLSLPQLWFYHHYHMPQNCAHPSRLAESLPGSPITNALQTCHFITQHRTPQQHL